MAERNVAAGNRLRLEQSPYLRQHADQPIEWYAWKDEAFAAAVAADKPIFLSIGYSTCHWCHVMAHESFDDPAVAALLNRDFISIKVDREEHPDVDAVYMDFCRMLTGGGGWPLTIVMTPQRHPFFAATYIPREDHYGRAGLLRLLPRLAEIWRTRRGEALAAAQQLVDYALAEQQLLVGRDTLPGPEILDGAAAALHSVFDERYGGFGAAPKFPAAHQLQLLLRHARRSGEVRSAEMVYATLGAMRRGGIYDQLGYGYHRYAVDEAWRVPHFEKMLLDQAAIAMAVLEAWQAGGDPLLPLHVQEIFTYVQERLTAPQGAFYCAEDADSDGTEGGHYLWSRREIRATLGEARARRFCEVFAVTAEEENILHLPTPAAETERRELLAEVRGALLTVRRRRATLARDEKILADANGRMAAALARAAYALGRPEYAARAAAALDFLRLHLRDAHGGWRHSWCNGVAGPPANLGDFAAMAWAALELHRAELDPRYLDWALEWCDIALRDFTDESSSLCFLNPGAAGLPLRPYDLEDAAQPGANAVLFTCLLHVAGLTGEERYRRRAEAMAAAMHSRWLRQPLAYTAWLSGLDFLLGPLTVVSVDGLSAGFWTRPLGEVLRRRFLPHHLMRPALEDRAERHEDRVVLCRDERCGLPIATPEALAAALDAD